MWDDKRRDRVFWGAAGLAVGLFIWVYSHSPNGEGDFADSPPSLAPSAAIQVASPSPVSEIPALSPSPASPSSSDASSVILPVTFGREIGFRFANSASSLWFVPERQRVEPETHPEALAEPISFTISIALTQSVTITEPLTISFAEPH